jgi:hypothetical protein
MFWIIAGIALLAWILGMSGSSRHRYYYYQDTRERQDDYCDRRDGDDRCG